MVIGLLITLLLFIPAGGQQSQGRPHFNVSELEQRIHQLINEERKRAKLTPLKWSPKMLEIAQRHSRDMARKDFFAHVNPEGQTPTQRAAAVGFRCEKRSGNRIVYGVGENIFQNNLYSRITYRLNVATYEWNSLEKIAVSSVREWMNSPGHRKNILNPSADQTAVGIAISQKDQVLITQLFC
jgi:uncharacterized protein YkwD